MYVTVKDTTIQARITSVRTFQDGTTAPITNYDHVSLWDHVTVQGVTSFRRAAPATETSDISNLELLGQHRIGHYRTLRADTFCNHQRAEHHGHQQYRRRMHV